jgi:hypothetical protein
MGFEEMAAMLHSVQDCLLLPSTVTLSNVIWSIFESFNPLHVRNDLLALTWTLRIVMRLNTGVAVLLVGGDEW